jgi:hypothetical protein
LSAVQFSAGASRFTAGTTGSGDLKFIVLLIMSRLKPYCFCGLHHLRCLPSHGQHRSREEKVPLDRRHFIAATGGAVVGPVGGSSGGRPPQAGAPVSRTQVPGFFRFSLGQFQVTVVSDGTLLFQRRRSGQKRVKRNATPSLFRTSSLRTNLLSK